MATLKAKCLRNHINKNGHKVFTYEVTGTPEQLAAYKAIQGEYHRTDLITGRDLFFTTKYFGDSGNLIITTNNRVIPDTSEFDKLASLASQYGGNLGQALANAGAAKLLGQKPADIIPQPAPEAQEAEEPTGGKEDLSE